MGADDLAAIHREFSPADRLGKQNDNAVRVSLDALDFESMGEPNVLDLHRFLIDMRDNHVSHSVNPFERVIIGVAQVDDQPAVVSLAQCLVGVPDKTIKELKDMAEFLIGVANEKSATAESIVLYKYRGLTEEQIGA